MNSNILKRLECKINAKRRQLENIVSERKATDEEILEISRELDKLIVVYQRMMIKE